MSNKKGMFEIAEGGTLFLDEISNISLATQAKLLRVIQEREFRAVGDTRTQSADFRLIAASNKDLQAMLAAGTFRDDLYYRINVFPIHSPALRDRREDIPALAFHFVKSFGEELGKNVDKISEGAMQPADELRLAGKCPRAGKRRAPSHDSRERQRPAQSTPARDHGGASGSHAGSAADRGSS